MIINEQARIYAVASHASYGNSPVSVATLENAGYARIKSLDDPTTGFHAEIYQHAVTGEALVAITGTQNGQDWAANTI